MNRRELVRLGWRENSLAYLEKHLQGYKDPQAYQEQYQSVFFFASPLFQNMRFQEIKEHWQIPTQICVLAHVTAQIKAVKAACRDKILKVIIETCYLTEEEKIAMCKAVTNAGADFIKTSTGFGTGGATKEDVELFKKYIGPNVKIKAAGGVSSMEDLEMFLGLGCERIGTSRAVGLCKGELTEGY